jgi:hypothetical protein
MPEVLSYLGRKERFTKIYALNIEARKYLITHFKLNSQNTHPFVKAIQRGKPKIVNKIDIEDSVYADIRFLDATKDKILVGGYFGGGIG